MTSDQQISCPNRRIAQSFEKKGIKVYMYEFAHFKRCMDFMGGAIPDPTDEFTEKWASHGSDFPYFWGNTWDFDDKNDCLFNTEEKKMVKEMMNMLGNFAKNGDPKNDWTEWNQGNDFSLVSLETPKKQISPFLHDEFCDFWDKFIGLEIKE